MELNAICRTCLRRGRPVQSLFDETDELFAGGTPLVNFVNMFTEMMVLRMDGFPEQICTACLNDIKRAYAFKLRCECSESTLYRLRETNTILDLDKFNFEIPYIQAREQVEENLPNNWNDIDNASGGRFLEITESVINLLQIECSDDEVTCNDTLQAELNALLQQEIYVQTKLEELNAENGKETECEGENLLKCSACPSVFPDRTLLKTHVVDYHTDGQFCLLCQMEFEGIWSHVDQHLLPRLQCPHCSEKFEYRPLLNAHLRSHMIQIEETGQLAFKCEQCPRTFINHHEYVSHKRAHSEDRPFGCETCGMAFKRRDKLKAHMTSHSDERPFECSLCNSRFKRKDNLTSHLKSVHQQGDKVYKCTICDKAFRFRDKLRAHANTHLRLFSCETCHAGFPRKETLDRHVEQKHRSDGGATIAQAPIVCSSQFSVSSASIELKSFPCSVCNKEFNFPETLTNHMKTHVKKAELKCELCSKVFSQTNKLKSHMITHTDLRPFQCTFCPAEFKRKDNLNRHMKKHSRTKVGATTNPYSRNGSKLDDDFVIKCENDRLVGENCDNDRSDSNATGQLNERSEIETIAKPAYNVHDEQPGATNSLNCNSTSDSTDNSQPKLDDETRPADVVETVHTAITCTENYYSRSASYAYSNLARDRPNGQMTDEGVCIAKRDATSSSPVSQSYTIANLLSVNEKESITMTAATTHLNDRLHYNEIAVTPLVNNVAVVNHLSGFSRGDFSNSIMIVKRPIDACSSGGNSPNNALSFTSFTSDETGARVENMYDLNCSDSTTVVIKNET